MPMTRGGAERSRAGLPLARTVLHDQIRELLAGRILSGEYEPGARLVETRIADELGTSQGPVREALRELETMGLVIHEPFRGARVREKMPRQLVEVFPAREALEVAAVRLATPHLAKDPSALITHLEGMRATARAGDVAAFSAHDAAFHRTIVEAARNEPLLNAYEALALEGTFTAVMTATGVDLPELAEAHAPVLRALAEGKMSQAITELRRHYAETLRSLRYRERARRQR